MTRQPCPELSRIEAHFRGALDSDEERAMRAHLPTCDACENAYRRHRLFATLDPTAMSAKNRIGAPLTLVRRSPVRAIGVFAAVAAAAAVVLVIQNYRAAHAPSSEFASRGANVEVDGPNFRVYHAPKGGTPTLVDDVIEAGDEVSFSLHHVGSKRRVLVFAVDEQRHVYWYHPAWTRAEDTPVAIPILTASGASSAQRTPDVVPLAEAVVHTLPIGTLDVRAVFVDDAVSVRDVEARVARLGDPSANLDIPGSVERHLLLRVVR